MIDRDYEPVLSREEQIVFHFFLDEILHGIKIIVSCLLIGLFLRMLPQTLVFLCVYPLLRHYLGGLHADTRLKCYLATLCTYGICLWGFLFGNTYLLLAIALICCGYIFKLGIAEHPNNILTLAQKEKFLCLQRRAVTYFLLWGMLGAVYLPQCPVFKMLLSILILNGGNLIMFKRLTASLHAKKLSQHAARIAGAFVFLVGSGAMSGVTCLWNYQPEMPAEVSKYLSK